MNTEKLQPENSIDEKSLQLLKELQINGRLSFNALGRLVGMSTPAVAERVKRLEESGVITGYHASIDQHMLDNKITAYMRLNTTTSSYQRLIGLCNSVESVIECHHLTGDDCFLIKLCVSGMLEFEDVISLFRQFGTAHTSVVLSSPIT